MEVLTLKDLDARISSARPLKAAIERPQASAQNPESLWNIELPWEPGTFVSIMWAKLHAAQLLQRVAEAEKRELQREFAREQERSKEIGRQYIEAKDQTQNLIAMVCQLRKQLRNKRAKR